MLPQSARRAGEKVTTAVSVAPDRSHGRVLNLSFIGIGYLAVGVVRGVEGPELRSSLLSGRSCRISIFVAPGGGSNTKAESEIRCVKSHRVMSAVKSGAPSSFLCVMTSF